VYAFNWKKLSISAALGYRWDGARCRLWFQTRPGSYNDESLMVFPRNLKRHLRGQKAILIWDGLPAHKSRKRKQYLGNQRGWLQVEMLPGYSPDLNPVEDLWGNVKGQELANRCVLVLARPKRVCARVWRGCVSQVCRSRSSTTQGSFVDPNRHSIMRDSVNT